MSPERAERGLSLIELVVFIVVLGIGLAGTLVAYNQATRSSVDPLVRKQVLAIAASLLEEIQLRGFTYCDPDDANVFSATIASTAATPGETPCATKAEAPPFGPDATPVNETSRTAYDNVNDYHGLTMSGIQDIQGNAVAGLGQYQASVSVTTAGASFGLSAEEALLIAVTVSGPAQVGLTLHGYRFRYAPNSP